MKLKVGLPFLSNKRAEFGVGAAKIQDRYFQKNVIDFDKDKYDKSTYSLFGGSISFNGSTLNSRQFPTQGAHEELVAQIFTGKECFIREKVQIIRRRVRNGILGYNCRI